MPPLARPATPHSLHSWWSDRNPLGATISIHAAAKPLIKLMYHEQVRSFIKKNRGIPLSGTTMEICLSYLAFKYISPITKGAILKELNNRLESEAESHVAVQSLVIDEYLVEEMLALSNAGARRSTCNILAALASSSETTPSAKVCTQLVSFLSAEDSKLRRTAVYALSKLSSRRSGAQAVSQTQVLEHVPALLNPADIETRTSTSEMLGNLAFHNCLAMVQSGLELCKQIMPLTSQEDEHVRETAVVALSKIGLRIADALDDLEILKYFAAYLDSANPRLRESTCSILGNISVHGSSPLALLGVAPYVQIVSLLRDDTRNVQRKALYALSKMTHWFHGAQAVIDAKILEYVPDILDWSDAQAREWTCEMLGNLAYHGHISVLNLDSLLPAGTTQFTSITKTSVFERVKYLHSRRAAAHPLA
ncbi:armadillo-type protein [Mycena metata]|uniref:Armadillo-type protein n=1 Tax=Mycena metata TaxID=1033252 RepID=A0AAD7N1G9_9AGAR|nr:armadillo-type protein [Mycena metata]